MVGPVAIEVSRAVSCIFSISDLIVTVWVSINEEEGLDGSRMVSVLMNSNVLDLTGSKTNSEHNQQAAGDRSTCAMFACVLILQSSTPHMLANIWRQGLSMIKTI